MPVMAPLSSFTAAPWRMATYESKPSAAVKHILPCVAHITVGSHRLSRVSIRRKTASCSAMSACSFATSFFTFGGRKREDTGG